MPSSPEIVALRAALGVSGRDPVPRYTQAMESLGTLTDSERDAFEERAAIVEYMRDWPKPIAKAKAGTMLRGIGGGLVCVSNGLL